MAKKQIVKKEVPAEPVVREIDAKTGKPLSNGEVWEFSADRKIFTITQSGVAGYSTFGYAMTYPLAVKNADNTVSIYTKYRNDKTGKIITITDKILNYYKEDGSLNDQGYKIISSNYNKELPIFTTKATKGEYVLEDDDKIYATTKNDVYKADGLTTTVEVFDEAGNDSYEAKNIADGKLVRAIDTKGNDTYKVLSQGRVQYDDYDGNDKYSTIGAFKEAQLNDYKGNDKYTFGSNDGNDTSGKFSVRDTAGNDSYTATKVTLTTDSSITDSVGNDKYSFTDSKNLKLTDSLGKDKYTLSNLDNTSLNHGEADYHIIDEAGNDKYTINKGTQKVSLYDKNGKDAWSLTGAEDVRVYDTDGNDKYTLVDNSGAIIKDTNGDDKFTVTNGVNTKITDTKGNDSYKYSINKTYVAPTDDTAGLSVTDSVGKDNYTVSGIAPVIKKKKVKSEAVYLKNVKIQDTGLVAEGAKADSANDAYKLSYVDNSALSYGIVDSYGSDKYTVSNSKAVQIKDDQGNDTYNYTGSTGRVDDSAATVATDDKSKYEKNTFNVKNSRMEIYTNSVNTTDGGITITGNHISTDTYNFTASSGIIHDYDDGADKYNFKKLEENKILTVMEYGGNDNYNISGSKGTFHVSDLKGDDVYKIDKSTFTAKETLTKVISDYDGWDEYIVSNSNDIVLEDSAATLTPEFSDENYFVMKKSKNFTINVNTDYNDKGYTEDDDARMQSFDMYVISNSTGVINDCDELDDYYVFDKMNSKVTINDNAGYDIIDIESAKQKNLVFMANANSDGTLFIYDKANKGYIAVNNYFAKEGTSYTGLTRTQDGNEYLLQLGKNTRTARAKDITATITTYDKFNSVAETVANFLSTGAGKDYGTIQDVLNSGDKTAINGLVACFTNNK